MPRTGLGIVRRAIAYALVTWLSIAVWVAFAGRAVSGTVDEPLLQHFGVNVRCLIVIPLLVLAEGMAHADDAVPAAAAVRARRAGGGQGEETLKGVARLRD